MRDIYTSIKIPGYMFSIFLIGILAASGCKSSSPSGAVKNAEGLTAPSGSKNTVVPTQEISQGWSTYTNTELKYSVFHPSNWDVDDFGMSQLNKEVTFTAPDAQPYSITLSIFLDERTMDTIEQTYANELPDVPKSMIELSGQPAIKYDSMPTRAEIYVPYQGKVYVLITDYKASKSVQDAIDSFTFLP